MDKLLIISLVFLLTISFTCSSVGKTRFKSFIDITDFAPVGCTETTMWRTTKTSKLSCAVSCMLAVNCAVFRFSEESNQCSLCPGDVIRNLTFTSNRVYSWPYTVLENYVLSPYYNTFILEISIPAGIKVGSVVCTNINTIL